MVTEAQAKAQKKYDKAHTQSILLKLNVTNDADILAKLKESGNRQGYIKRLIREDIRGNEKVLSAYALRLLVQPVAKKYGLKEVYLFGSYARGEASADSDVDIMIEGGNIESAEDYFSVQRQLENAFGKPVDLIMANALRQDRSRTGKRLMSHIDRDKVVLYEAVQ